MPSHPPSAAPAEVDDPSLGDVTATALDIAPISAESNSETVTITGDGPRASGAEPADATERRAPEVPAGTVLDGRYRLDERVGAGGGGLVYRACDLSTDERVAVKLLHPDRVADERARMRFRREFRAITRLDHPHCLTVRAEGRAGPYLYMVMDFVAGGDLGRLAGAPLERLLPILVKLAHALDYVHGQRIVHRDLKPGNVLLSADEPPEPKLADFGIAAMQSETDEGLLRSDGTLRGETALGERPRAGEVRGAPGTVDYMSPEQACGEPVDPRTDLYAFGCLIFRLFAGRPPFEGSPYNRLVARVLQPAPALDSVCAADPRLSAIVARLLERDPDARYQSALDLARDLAELAPGAAGILRDSLDAPGAAWLFDPGLVGREAERARLAGHLGSIGGPRLLAVVAPAGTGKTRLTQAALAAHRGPRVTVRVEAAGDVPFAPFPALEAAFTDARLPVDARPRSARPGAEPWTAALEARIERLAEAMRAAGSTAVLVDDLHLAEPGALALLGELLDRLGEAGPPILATARPVGAAALDRLGARVPIDRLTLDPLDAAATARMVAGMLGLRPERLPDQLGPLVHRSSQGNPLLIATDAQVLAESGALRRIRGGWRFEPPGRDGVLATELLQARMARLVEPTRRVLARAALCGDHFDTALLAEAFGLAEGELLDALDDALRARIIRPVEAEDGGLDRYVFGHARLTEVLYEAIDPAERARGHRLIAERLAARAGTAPSMLAHHFGRSDDRVAACRALLAAGDAALAVYAFEAAGRFFEQAAGDVEALPEARRAGIRAAIDERLADVWVALGRAPEAVALLVPLTHAPGQTALDRARRLRKLGCARLRTPDADAGVGALELALAALGNRRPATRFGVIASLLRHSLGALALRFWPRHADLPELREQAICHRELGFMYRWIDMERGGAHLARSIELATVLGDAELLIDGYSHAAIGFAFIGLPGPAQRLEAAARRLALDERDRVGEARVEVLSGALDTMVLGDEPAARAHFGRALALAEQIGDRFLTDFVCASKGWCVALLGHFDESLRDFTAARISAVELGADWLRADANAGMMMLDVACGRPDDARQRARALAGPEIAVPMPALGALGTEGLGAVAFQEGRFRAALGLYARALQQYRDHHLERGWGYLVELEQFEALLCLADTEGRDAVPRLVPRLRRVAREAIRKLARMRPYAGCAEVLRGTIAARQGRGARARRLFARAFAVRTGPVAYFDSWIRVRSTIECMHLGDPPAQITAQLDAVAALYAELGAHGMSGWLAIMRRHYGV